MLFNRSEGGRWTKTEDDAVLDGTFKSDDYREGNEKWWK